MVIFENHVDVFASLNQGNEVADAAQVDNYERQLEGRSRRPFAILQVVFDRR